MAGNQPQRGTTRRRFLTATGAGVGAFALAGCSDGGDGDDGGSDNYNRISVGYGEQGSAMNEGRLDVGVGTYLNFQIAPGWLQDMMAQVDLRILGAPDDVRQDWEDDDRLLVQSFPGQELENAAYVPDEVHCPTFAYNFVSRNDLDYDTVYEFLTTLYEHRDELSDYSAVLARLENEEFWLENMYDGVPFHPAAADFYQEVGLWSDEFERADEADEQTGGSQDGEAQFRMRTSESTTAAYAANQGMAAVVNEYSDEVFVEAQTSPGTEANMGALNNEEAESVYIQNWSARDVRDGNEPYDDLDFEMTQIMHFYDLPWFFCTANEGWETLADIEEGSSISPTPSGSGTAPALEHALEYVFD